MSATVLGKRKTGFTHPLKPSHDTTHNDSTAALKQEPAGSALNTKDSDEDMDVDDLLDAATKSLSKSKPVRKPSIQSNGTKTLIDTKGGVAKLNPDVLIAQTEKQALAQHTEKVSHLHRHYLTKS